MNQKMLDKAIKYATKKHRGQYRKKSDLPYIVHPMEVLKLVRAFGVTDYEVLCATVLHDVIEDCEVSYKTIKKKFTKRIADIVLECSRKSDHETKCEFLLSFETKSIESVIIKIADRLCNCADYKRESSGAYYLKYALQAYVLFSRIDRNEFSGKYPAGTDKLMTTKGFDQMMIAVSDLSIEVNGMYGIHLLEDKTDVLMKELLTNTSFYQDSAES